MKFKKLMLSLNLTVSITFVTVIWTICAYYATTSDSAYITGEF